jgi:UDP-N-acetylmuramoyl-L-alanyl-D-glutamate--2,6-diaminopimelate ligase
MLELHTPLEAANWLRQHVTGTLCSDSRKLSSGDGLIAWPGARNDARQYVAIALEQGAAACLVERNEVEPWGFASERVASYANLQAASSAIAGAYFANPTQQLDLLAVTGTNGKTSTAWWLSQALSNLKHVAPVPCALVGTLGVGLKPGALFESGLTTPDPVLLQQTLRRFVDAGMQACAIEASSVGLQEHRLDGCHIRCAIFTNFTQDHLDYHGSMAAYWAAKVRLFDWPGLTSAVINIDDVQGVALAASLSQRVPNLWSISCTGPARLQARALGYDERTSGLHFEVQEPGTDPVWHRLQTRMLGSYNVSNLLGVLATMRVLGVPLAAAVAACGDLSPVPGRMECVGAPGQPLVAVDYAHTPDALAQALLALRPLARQRGGQLWCIFGCGGDRDRSKRPLMGAMAASHADRVLLTSDNPRSEKMDAIISQILLGLSGDAAVEVEPDRAQAIAYALSQAQARDVLLIAGKGHEDYQEVAGQRKPFSDLKQVREALAVYGEVVQ